MLVIKHCVSVGLKRGRDRGNCRGRFIAQYSVSDGRDAPVC